MKHFLFILLCILNITVFAQADKVFQAEAALSNSDYTGAYELTNAALQNSSGLDKITLAKARYIRGKAGAKVSYDALLGKDAALEKQFINVPLQSYRDLKQAANEASLKDLVALEYTKLGNALLVAGTEYDSKFKEQGEKPDSSILEKAIENLSASIEVFSNAGSEKFKPYLFRGDGYFAKKNFNAASDDYLKAMKLFEGAPHDNPDFNIGDLGYRLAYLQAAIFNKKETALQTSKKTRTLLAAELQLAEQRKSKYPDRYADWKADYAYFIEQLDELEKGLK